MRTTQAAIIAAIAVTGALGEAQGSQLLQSNPAAFSSKQVLAGQSTGSSGSSSSSSSGRNPFLGPASGNTGSLPKAAPALKLATQQSSTVLKSEKAATPQSPSSPKSPSAPQSPSVAKPAAAKVEAKKSEAPKSETTKSKAEKVETPKSKAEKPAPDTKKDSKKDVKKDDKKDDKKQKSIIDKAAGISKMLFGQTERKKERVNAKKDGKYLRKQKTADEIKTDATGTKQPLSLSDPNVNIMEAFSDLVKRYAGQAKPDKAQFKEDITTVFESRAEKGDLTTKQYRQSYKMTKLKANGVGKRSTKVKRDLEDSLEVREAEPEEELDLETREAEPEEELDLEARDAEAEEELDLEVREAEAEPEEELDLEAREAFADPEAEIYTSDEDSLSTREATEDYDTLIARKDYDEDENAHKEDSLTGDEDEEAERQKQRKKAALRAALKKKVAAKKRLAEKKRKLAVMQRMAAKRLAAVEKKAALKASKAKSKAQKAKLRKASQKSIDFDDLEDDDDAIFDDEDFSSKAKSVVKSKSKSSKDAMKKYFSLSRYGKSKSKSTGSSLEAKHQKNLQKMAKLRAAIVAAQRQLDSAHEQEALLDFHDKRSIDVGAYDGWYEY